MITAHEVLKAARALIEDPSHWTQGEMARDARGYGDVNEISEQAVCWCSAGALLRACYRPNEGIYDKPRLDAFRALSEAAFKRGEESIVVFNDRPDTTHADVLAVFDEAIEATKEQS